MSIITFPDALGAVKVNWREARLDIAFESVFGSQGVEIAGPLWALLLQPKQFNRLNYADWEALLLKLCGRQNQLEVWHLDRPAPLGTMRGTMIFNGAQAQGATTLTISASGQGGKTLLTGDHLGFGSGTTQQVVKVVDPATADGSGNITVNVKQALRNSFAAGASVTWDKPKALFRRVSTETSMEHTRGSVTGIALDLIEDWRP